MSALRGIVVRILPEAARSRLRQARTDLRNALAGNELEELRLLRNYSRYPFDINLPHEVQRTVSSVHEEHLSYLEPQDLEMLASLVVEVERAGREGVIIEAGTALGGSAIVMASAKKPGRVMRVYDVFGMIPPPSESDGPDVHRRYEHIKRGRSAGINDQQYYGYRDDLLSEVAASFERHRIPMQDSKIELIKGLFEQTLEVHEDVVLAHLDGDWYSSTMTCLDRIAPRLVDNGRIVIDDYYDWSGCRTAVDEYISQHPEFRLEYRARVHLVKK